MRETIETAMEAELFRRFDTTPHPLKPTFDALTVFDPRVGGWYLKLTMRVADYDGRVRQADLGITKWFLEEAVRDEVGPPPGALAEMLAILAGQPTYEEKIHTAGIDYCGEKAEQHFREVLKGEVQRRQAVSA